MVPSNGVCAIAYPHSELAEPPPMVQPESSPVRRKPLRWTGFDYRTPGVYFVTICTGNRRPLPGHVDDTGRLHPSSIGWSVSATWDHLPMRFAGLELVAFIAMPDHIHGLLAIAPSADEAGAAPALERVVNVFKAVANHRVRKLDERADLFGSLWQRGFHDRVVRSDDEMRQIEGYIAENPARWAASRMSLGGVDGGASLA